MLMRMAVGMIPINVVMPHNSGRYFGFRLYNLCPIRPPRNPPKMAAPPMTIMIRVAVSIEYPLFWDR